MRKLSEYKDEESLDLLADLLEPCVEIFTDKTLVGYIRGKDKMKAIQYAIKNHKKEVVQVMARLEETPVEEFHYNLFTLPVMVLGVFNDKDLVTFFTSVVRTDLQNGSGSDMENTEEKE